MRYRQTIKNLLTTFGLPFDWAGKKVVKYRRPLSLGFVTAMMFFPPVAHAAIAPKISAQNLQQKPSIVRSDSENFYLAAVNQLRFENNLPQLTIDSRLSSSATDKAYDMTKSNYFGHWAPNGKSFSDFIWHNSPQANSVGENLARCFKNRQDAFTALVASPTHFAIMVGQYTNFGVAEVYDADAGCTNTVMHFSTYKDKLYFL